ncbi:glycosyltransferase family 2 protein [Floricoccus penangensis]|uniref:glycosyltransferase family 2 protein n=1 Tax=Floricoccus penangensis TaxID=1859475 RepID=UPI0020407262|nr:glycosyltransferase family 2 protein [Floricoccus penangensis]URZ87579.1 glycosyltransferase family 2 protein [Floricoccus penangensis]
MRKNLSIILPCYNEEEVLPISSEKIMSILLDLINKGKISNDSNIVFVDDGSSDKTWTLIERLVDSDSNHYNGIKLSRNFGHQNALMAGMTSQVDKADMIITIDADLQDDIDVIEDMVDAYNEGYDVVYGVRNNRDSDTAFKRKTAETFYKLMNKAGIEMVPNHADFRLLSQRAVNTLLSFPEKNLFLRGLVPLLGYPNTKVYYSRKKREAGESKYPLKKMISFAKEGLTSFTILPITFVRNLGYIVLSIGIIYTIYTLIQWSKGAVENGWSSIIITLWLLGGFQLISISIIGEYIGKIYWEVKHRPRFIIETNLTGEVKEDHER